MNPKGIKITLITLTALQFVLIPVFILLVIIFGTMTNPHPHQPNFRGDRSTTEVSSPQPTNQSISNRYEDPANHFSIQSSNGWQLDQNGPTRDSPNGTAHIVAVFQNPLADHDSNDQPYHASLNVGVEYFQNESPGKTVTESRQDLKDQFQGYDISFNQGSDLSVNGQPVHIFDLPITVKSTEIHLEQLIVSANGDLYTVTASALDSAWIKHYQQSVPEVVKSFWLSKLQSRL